MADMGLTEVAAAVQKEISSFVQAELKQKAILLNTVQQFPAGPGIDTIKIPRADSFTAADKAENTALTAQVLTFATDDLALDKHKAVLVKLEDIAQLQAKPDVVREIMMRMGTELALQIDKDIMTQLVLTSASAPDHRIAYAGSAIAQADILEARRLLYVQNVPFNECYLAISPTQEKALLGIADFVRADAYGDARGLIRGEIGTLYGCKVIVSNVVADAKSVVYHPTHVAFALQQSLNFEKDRDLDNIATKYLASQIYGMKVLDSGNRGVVLGTAT